MADAGTRTATIRYARTFPYPLGPCFEWLTDYQDDDPARTTTLVVHRPVVEKGENRYVLDGTLEILGTKMKGLAEVVLFPPDRYEARIEKNGRRLSTYRYRLTPVAGGTRLDVEYEVVTRRLGTWIKLQLARPLIRRQIDRMWDGFAASMAKDLNA